MVQQRKLQSNASCSSSKKFQEKKTIYLNVKFPSLNLRKKAESAEVLNKGPTTYIFTTYFFYYSSKTHRQSLVILIFCLRSLPLTWFQVKSFLVCYEDPLLFMMNNLDNNRKKFNYFLLSISKQISKTYLGKSNHCL